MRYPYIAYSSMVDIYPLFSGLQGDPLIVDMSDNSQLLDDIDVRDQKKFQRGLDRLMRGKFSWGVSSYLENRKKLLSPCPQMVEEQRFFHLGLDIIVPLGTHLNAPLAAIVKKSGYEKGDGNYGGHVLLAHESRYFETFYSFYGHLNREKLPPAGTILKPGQPFAYIGDFHENGNWFFHTHLQILTQKAFDMGYISKGYCSAEDLAQINSLCPSPLPLFRI